VNAMPDNPAPGLFRANLPLIPNMLMRTLYALDYHTSLNQDSGGQYILKEPDKREITGVLMPLSNKDIQYIEEGAYSVLSEKLYTNGDYVKVGMYVLDPDTGYQYKVSQELTHNRIHPLRRYMLERKEGVDAP
jgi:hypothetical protein